MMKRKQTATSSDEDPLQTAMSTPQKRRIMPLNRETNGATKDSNPPDTPASRLRSRAPKQSPQGRGTASPSFNSPNRKPVSRPLFVTPTKPKSTKGTTKGTPSRIKNADQSAKRKSARILVNPDEDDMWDGGDKLARKIWETHPEDGGDEDGIAATKETKSKKTPNKKTETPTTTPQRRRGRPKLPPKPKRSPTPEGDLPPFERYFFQTRPGPMQSSNNTLTTLSLFTHEEYFEQLGKYKDPLHEQKEYLSELHERSFPQWNLELREGYSVCLHGYGSKRKLVQKFADWQYNHYKTPPTIVIVNGYTPNVTMRSILATIATAVLGPDHNSKLGSQPSDVLEFLQSTLRKNPPSQPIMVLINSIDSPALRRAQNQPHFARLADLPHVSILATADTPNFLVLWDIGLRDQFNFVFHDCTTFVPYDIELNVVDEVHNLVGRKVRRVGGKQGVGFVLKSLPENTRKLYRLLITEILTLLGDQLILSGDEDDDDDPNGEENDKIGRGRQEAAAIEWRTLFNKASEEFISSSEMMFRTQLKEFYDHQMITSKIDSIGGEMLGIPLSQEEMESVLEDLVEL